MVEVALGAVTAYFCALFAVAWWAKRRAARGRSPSENPVVYALAQGVYVTGWALFGDVGSAARTGLEYTATYLGPTLVMLFAGSTLRRLIRLKNAQGLTSVADLVSTRYGKSQGVGVVVTLFLLLGLLPYLALQFQTLLGALERVSGRATAHGVGPLLVVGLIAFTILLGQGWENPTGRHPGVVAALAFESTIKLFALAALGLFAVWFLFDGPSDLFERAQTSAAVAASERAAPLSTWLAGMALSASAFLFLPRQFQIAVVENERESHLRTSRWLVPLFFLLLALFPLPLALAGLVMGLPASQADSFLVSIPLAAGQPGLVRVALLGGVAAASGMVVVETMALSTMASNHLLLPLLDATRRGEFLRRRILQVRWVVAALVIAGAYAFEEEVGRHHTLATVGRASFAAVFQLAPAALAGLYWRRANKAGAMLGLLGGIGIWAYTLVLPIVLRAGAASSELLARGPFGIGWLRPEALFGLGLEPVANTVFFSLLVNVTLLVLGSLLFDQSEEEAEIAERFVGILAPAPCPAAPRPEPSAEIAAEQKHERVARLFGSFFGPHAAAPMAAACFAATKLPVAGRLSIEQVVGLEAEVERTLASAIGSPAAHVALKRAPLLDPPEAAELARHYAELLARLRIPREELRRQVDYHEERNRLLTEEAHTQSCLATASGKLVASLDPEATAQTASRLPVPCLVEAALLCVEKPGPAGVAPSWRLIYADADPARERLIGDGLAKLGLEELAPLALAAQAGIPLWEPADGPARWPAPLAELGFGSSLCLPLVAGQRTIGAWALFCTPGSRFAHPRDLALAQELAFRAALALDNAASHWRAQAAVRTRNEFIGMAAHELRTPLVPLFLQIQNLQRMLVQGRLTEERMPRVAGLLAGAEGQLGRLAALVDRMLDTTQLTSGKLRLQRERMDLVELLRSLVERVGPQAERAGCALALEAPERLVGYWDRLRLDQSVTNLLVNAIKYAPGQPIALSVERHSGEAWLRVRDGGPGIAPADQERIFLAFERAVSAEHFPGMGLGLFLTRQIVEAHGGRLTLESVEGQGATFVAKLPMELPLTGPMQTTDAGVAGDAEG